MTPYVQLLIDGVACAPPAITTEEDPQEVCTGPERAILDAAYAVLKDSPGASVSILVSSIGAVRAPARIAGVPFLPSKR